MMKMIVMDSWQVAEGEVQEFGEAEEGGAVVPVNKEEGKVVEVAVQEPVQKTEAVGVEAVGVDAVQLEVTRVPRKLGTWKLFIGSAFHSADTYLQLES